MSRKRKTIYYEKIILFVNGYFFSFNFSCSKDDDLTPDNLAATIWISDDKESSVEFLSKTQFKFNWTDYYGYEKNLMHEDGIYSVDKNSITFDFGDDEPLNGMIDGNSITFIWLGDIVVVKKQ